MSPSDIVLKLVHDALVGGEVRVDTFRDRLVVQKKFYLGQLTGLDLGYRFAWYLHGPYCRQLTADIFRLKEQLDSGDHAYEGAQLGVEARRRLDRAREIWEGRPADIDEDDWLELLASLHYLKHIAYWPAGGGPRDFDGVFRALAESKPRFANRRADAQHAWRRLDEVGLVESKLLP